MKTIIVEQVTRVFNMGTSKVYALANANLQIDEGDFISIMGTSGSGKSTLLNILGLLDQPTSGTYQLEGIDVSMLGTNQLAELRSRRIGQIFQDFKLLSKMKAWENVSLPLVYGNRHLSFSQQKDLALQALEKVSLSDRSDHLPSELSGGQRQRVAIARALVTNPAVILADEPTGNLDSKTGKEIMQLLLNLNRDGITVVLVTHDASVAKVANHIYTMADGHLSREEEN